MDSRFLILVRHSAVRVEPAQPAREWCLSADGETRALRLADHLAAYDPFTLFSSEEVKAQQTAAIIASRFRVPRQTAGGLYEHVRHTFVSDRAEWEAAVAAFFTHPDTLMLGTETARQAQTRFDQALRQLIQNHPAGNLVVVTHGTVLTLFLALHNSSLNPFAVWQSLPLPCYFVLTLPALHLTMSWP